MVVSPSSRFANDQFANILGSFANVSGQFANILNYFYQRLFLVLFSSKVRQMKCFAVGLLHHRRMKPPN